MRMLFPDAVEVVDPVVVYADLPRVEHRPCVRLNMIVSVDGGTSWGGVSGALGGPADKALFSVLRSVADVVLVAAGTMRAEKYGPAQLATDGPGGAAPTRAVAGAADRRRVAQLPDGVGHAVLHGGGRAARS